MTLTVAVDGSSLGNPGPAGWAWVISADQWDAGGWDHGTNNLGELTAVQQILRATQEAGLANEPLHLLADSQYAINVITKWMHGWKRRGWTKADKKPIANLELIQDIDRLIAGRTVTFEWVRGHAGHSLNEMADTRAREAAEQHQAGTVAPGGPGLKGSPRLEGHPGLQSSPELQGRPELQGSQGVEGSPEVKGSTEVRGSTGLSGHPEQADAPHPPGSSRETSLSVAVVKTAQRQLIDAWLNGDSETANGCLAEGFERVWPNGARTQSFSGPRPPHAHVGRLSVRPAGSAIIVSYQLTWDDGRSIETSVWEAGEHGPLIVHHQSTPLAPQIE